jgi:hypothetical protein
MVGHAEQQDEESPFGPGERGPPLEKKQIFSTCIATLNVF